MQLWRDHAPIVAEHGRFSEKLPFVRQICSAKFTLPIWGA
jgi:hypothetical protein